MVSNSRSPVSSIKTGPRPIFVCHAAEREWRRCGGDSASRQRAPTVIEGAAALAVEGKLA